MGDAAEFCDGVFQGDLSEAGSEVVPSCEYRVPSCERVLAPWPNRLIPSGAKARALFFESVTARLNVVPFPVKIESKLKGSGRGRLLHTTRTAPNHRLLKQSASVAVRLFFWFQDARRGYAVAGLH